MRNYEKEYSKLYLKYIQLVQKWSKRSQSAHLIFGPIGSNVTFLSNVIHINAKWGFKTIISLGNYPIDNDYIAKYNEQFNTNYQALPWILQRYGNNYHHLEPWKIWFEGINENDSETKNYSKDISEIKKKLKKLKKYISDTKVLELSVCIAYVLRFNEKWEKILKKQELVSVEEKAVAVHIRRGDACSSDFEVIGTGRKHYSTEEYIKAMDEFHERGYKKYLILTESQKVVNEIKKRRGEQYEIVAADFDRSKFVEIEKGSTHFDFIEYKCLDNPAFTEFLNLTALIDLYNAKNCSAFIGNKSSQFSLMVFFCICNHLNKVAPSIDLSKFSYSKILFTTQDNTQRSIFLKYWKYQFNNLIYRFSLLFFKFPNGELWKDKLYEWVRSIPYQLKWKTVVNELKKENTTLVIKERDVGFFSLFLQVINTLLYIHEHKLKCHIAIDFGNSQSYYQGKNTWEEYFENITDKVVPIEKLIEVQLDFNKYIAKKDMLLWDKYGIIYQVNPKLFWTGSYYPLFSKDSNFKYIKHTMTPLPLERKRGAAIIRQYIKTKPIFKVKVEQFKNKYFKDKYIIGVQFRGTDARKDKRRVVPKYEEVFQIMQNIQIRKKEKAETILFFLASDEQAFIEVAKQRFDNTIACDVIRHSSGNEEIVKDGPSGWGMPSFVVENSSCALEGVLLDYLLLCESKVLIHPVTSVSNAVLLTNPTIESILVGKSYIKD